MNFLMRRKGNGANIPSLQTQWSDFFDNVDTYFNELLPASFRNKSYETVVPPANIIESDNEYIVELGVPGMEKKDFKIEVENGKLEIEVEKESETKEEQKQYVRQEYSYRTFYRSFELPDDVDAEKIKAKYDNGVLRIYLSRVKTSEKKELKTINVA